MYRRFCSSMVPEINIPTLLQSPSLVINHTTPLLLYFPLNLSLFQYYTVFPFTASQWQELEHQALIFKYMVSGIPIPPDLLFSIKRSYLDSAMPSKLFPHHPQHRVVPVGAVGWNCFQMGMGRKIDPEPGRCRRTDGKKWRCSKEAFPDSKYCERHMHRGKNRSRKPVEVLKTTTSTSSTNSMISNPSLTPTNISSITKNLSAALTPTSRSSISSFSSLPSYNSHHIDHPFLYNHSSSSSSSSSRHPGFGLSPQHHDTSTTSLLLDSGSYSQTHNADYSRNRYAYGMKEEVDHEHVFFSEEPSGNVRRFSGGSSSSSLDDQSSWKLTPLTMSCSSSKQRNCSGLQNEQYSNYLQLQSRHKQDHHYQQQQNYSSYVFNGNDTEMERKEETQNRTMHRFFDEWPVKDKDSWLDLDDKSSNSGSISTTRLSISMPTSSSHEFPIFTSRTGD
ncbi:growth-regulating factor 5 isoform X2 [Ziziphus jujuba]|uniref:Growth-regulating factor n=1 Tax=Ziziphus jujuba TaxID=326968 RepID=A0A6P4A2R8_ZIZJJ|nr:growth-regulating factor 5 isoform X2 [Ziziphus jujuba]